MTDTEAWIFSAQANYAIRRTCTVIIGMIPSGMLLLTSVALAVGVIRLAKHNTLVPGPVFFGNAGEGQRFVP